MKKGRSVFVALSGGVDSAVAASILKEEGHDVVGIYMKTWAPPGYPCPWKEEKRDAARVCAALRIPFAMWDFTEAYKKRVVDSMLADYAEGRTPNPDILCNKEIKFGLFFNEAIEHGADYIATGHYARVARRGRNYQLLRGLDSNKDQSYFLWTLTQRQLVKILFPIGEFESKEEVRAYARRRHLPVAEKKDSQGICFIGPLDMNEFLKEYIPAKSGIIRSVTGKELGTHEGLPFYTIGQREGVSVGGVAPHYVVAKVHKTNTLVVAPPSEERKLMSTALTASDVNWIGETPKSGDIADVQIRYRQAPIRARISRMASGKWRVAFATSVRAVTPGQSVVFYKKDQLLGGGVIA
jgi:tRNA-specific 2-thiouridylase